MCDMNDYAVEPELRHQLLLTKQRREEQIKGLKCRADSLSCQGRGDEAQRLLRLAQHLQVLNAENRGPSKPRQVAQPSELQEARSSSLRPLWEQ